MPITVCVADDHAIVREGLASLLGAQADMRGNGTAADGRDAVRQIAKLAPEIVVVDIANRSRLIQKLHTGEVAGPVKFAIQHGLTSLE